MQIDALHPTCTFVYLPELEPLWGAIQLLCNQEKLTAACASLYTEQERQEWRKTYPLLFETFTQCPWVVNMMDFLLDMPLDSFSLDAYQEAVLALPPQQFLWRLLDLEHVPQANMEDLTRALSDQMALERVFQWVADSHISFLALSALVRHSHTLIVQMFQLARDMKNQALASALEQQTPQIQALRRTILVGLETTEPLELSQNMMGKTFHNRGPYQEYVFLPTYLMPFRCARYFHTSGTHKRQLLFLSLGQNRRSQEDTVRVLKALSDGKRYEILNLLAKEGPLRGLDIAQRVSIATSTVSHHMEQLKDSGLITEEPVKNSKFYGLNRNAMEDFLHELHHDFLSEE